VAEKLACTEPPNTIVFLLLLTVFILSAVYLKFDILKRNAVNNNPRPGSLAIAIDIKAKIVRKDSLLVTLNKQRGIQEGGDYTREWTPPEIAAAQNYIGSVVLYNRDRQTYTVTKLDFDHTWDTLMIPGTDQSHSKYFANKGITLTHSGCKPILVVHGRRGSEIYFPPELASLNGLPPEDRARLPLIASFLPNVCNQAVDNLVAFLKKRETDDDSNLLWAAGFRLGDRKTVAGPVLPPPDIEASIRGGKVAQETLECFSASLKKINYKVLKKDRTVLRGVVFYNSNMADPIDSAKLLYHEIFARVDIHNAKYCLSETPWKMFDTGLGEPEQHLKAVVDYLDSLKNDGDNLDLFILDFCRPLNNAKTDPAYHPVKKALMEGGYVSQFVNYNTHDHFGFGDRMSGVILMNVARQILCKAGVLLYWSHIPPELPTPVMFVGIDITHAPFEFCQTSQRQTRAASYAAVVTETRLGDDETGTHLVHDGIKAEIISHSKVSRCSPGEEFNLADLIGQTMHNAVKSSGITPRSVIVWRDGISESASVHAKEDCCSPGTKKSPLPLWCVKSGLERNYIAMPRRRLRPGCLSTNCRAWTTRPSTSMAVLPTIALLDSLASLLCIEMKHSRMFGCQS
jgi:Piwi domain